ncbi:glycosyltransferase [Leptolyngbya sp. ST-U4]|uniref:glycosyltransferase n=1 Tax=Leptolyngbya sp. ST-U4 TaxID=2933912 RepID=UPI0019B7F878|nr:glycosyltransferase family 2 protein [Cyanobacteria bacterium FACHB-502]
MGLCEVRIPTYKRPQLLKRALTSLINQTHSNWIALVMDDSPAQEAKAVVTELEDERIQYTPNPTNLGCAGNLNRAFTSKALMDGVYACILEDDNWLMPNFIAENIASLETHGVDMMLRNQEIWLQERDTATPTDRTTRGDCFTDRVYAPIELQAHLFYFEGISNGGLFWRTSLQSNLQVSDDVSDAGLQEYCRTLQIQDKLYFAPQSLCYWSEMPSSLSLRNALGNRIFGRGVQSIKQSLIAKYGKMIVLEAAEIAVQLNKQVEFETSLLDSLFTHYPFQQLNILQCARQYLKSYMKFKLVSDPLCGYFASAPVHPA